MEKMDQKEQKVNLVIREVEDSQVKCSRIFSSTVCISTAGDSGLRGPVGEPGMKGAKGDQGRHISNDLNQILWIHFISACSFTFIPTHECAFMQQSFYGFIWFSMFLVVL